MTMEQEMPLTAETIMPENALPDATEEIMQREAERQNEVNLQCTPGSGGGHVPDFLTPAQVRAMDRQEVKDHYALIIESMKHWQ